MNRVLMYGGVFFGVVIMFLPVHERLLDLPVSCGNGWQAATATGDSGAVCNSAGQSRGLIAALVVVAFLVVAYIVARSNDQHDHDDALLAVLTSDQRLQYEATLTARATSQSRYGIVGRLAVIFVVVLIVLAIVVYA